MHGSALLERGEQGQDFLRHALVALAAEAELEQGIGPCRAAGPPGRAEHLEQRRRLAAASVHAGAQLLLPVQLGACLLLRDRAGVGADRRLEAGARTHVRGRPPVAAVVRWTSTPVTAAPPPAGALSGAEPRRESSTRAWVSPSRPGEPASRFVEPFEPVRAGGAVAHRIGRTLPGGGAVARDARRTLGGIVALRTGRIVRAGGAVAVLAGRALRAGGAVAVLAGRALRAGGAVALARAGGAVLSRGRRRIAALDLRRRLRIAVVRFTAALPRQRMRSRTYLPSSTARRRYVARRPPRPQQARACGVVSASPATAGDAAASGAPRVASAIAAFLLRRATSRVGSSAPIGRYLRVYFARSWIRERASPPKLARTGRSTAIPACGSSRTSPPSHPDTAYGGAGRCNSGSLSRRRNSPPDGRR